MTRALVQRGEYGFETPYSAPSSISGRSSSSWSAPFLPSPAAAQRLQTPLSGQSSSQTPSQVPVPLRLPMQGSDSSPSSSHSQSQSQSHGYSYMATTQPYGASSSNSLASSSPWVGRSAALEGSPGAASSASRTPPTPGAAWGVSPSCQGQSSDGGDSTRHAGGGASEGAKALVVAQRSVYASLDDDSFPEASTFASRLSKASPFLSGLAASLDSADSTFFARSTGMVQRSR